MAVAAANRGSHLGVTNHDTAVAETRRQVATVSGEVNRVDKGGVKQLARDDVGVEGGGVRVRTPSDII